MDRCICCGRELDYECTLVCWACANSGEGGNQHVAIHHPGHQRHCGCPRGEPGSAAGYEEGAAEIDTIWNSIVP